MKLLVVIDMQNDFITGSLGTKEAQEILPRVVQKVKDFDGCVFYTQDSHHSDYLKTQEGKLLTTLHCIYGTNGWEIPNKLEVAIRPKANHKIIKDTFGSEYLPYTIRKLWRLDGEDEIELCGVCTDICVISNALLLKTFFPEVKISVDASCCAGTTPEAHETALKAMKQCQIYIENVNEDEDQNLPHCCTCSHCGYNYTGVNNDEPPRLTCKLGIKSNLNFSTKSCKKYKET